MEDEKIKDPEKIVVSINENYGDSCLTDAVNATNSNSRKPEGYVEIYSIDKDGNKKKVGKNNLVLFHGREWLTSRLCNIANPHIDSKPEEYISWFGLGEGGAPVDDPLTPNTTINTMFELSSELPINNENTSCGDFRNGSYYKQPFDSIEFQQDSANFNRWLILKISTTINTTDANGSKINEAALFTSESIEGEYSGPFNIFSIVTFPTIVKDSSRQLVFYWYLYC